MIFNGSFFKGFVLGGLIGTILALFFTPTAGEETVSHLKTLTLDYKDMFEEWLLNPQADRATPASTTTIHAMNVAQNGHH